MSLIQEYRVRAKEVRQRLHRPPNSVPDTPIDLKRLPKGAVWSECRRLLTGDVVQEHHYPKPITFPRIVQIVADYFGIGVLDISGPDRRMWCVTARQIAIYMACKHTKLSSNLIGQRLNRDHSTIVHSRQKMERVLSSNEGMARLVAELERRLLG